MNSVQGAFPGSVLPSIRIEALIAAHVPKKHIKDVAEIYDLRWWDYRRLAPGHSFMLFCHNYYRAFRLAAKKYLAYQRRHDLKGIVGPGAMMRTADGIWEMDASHITGMWKAMLTADMLGMPYDMFCKIAMEVATVDGWKRLPQPRQLYNEKMGARILMEWDQLRANRIFTACHPLYRTENYEGLKMQDDYREWLIDEIRDFDRKVPALLNAIWVSEQLPEALARQNFPANVINRAATLR